MPPTPTIERAPTPPLAHPVPLLNLRVDDLAHPGVETFFRVASYPPSALKLAVERVLSTLYPSSLPSPSPSAPPPAPKHHETVNLHLKDFDGVAYTFGSDVHLSTSYLSSVSSSSSGDLERVKHEIEGVLVHELVHVFQYDGSGEGREGEVPWGVIEGVADWVRLESGAGARHWREHRQEEGRGWDAGYETTGFFLRWLSSHLSEPHLVPRLNLALRNSSWEDGRHLRKLLKGEEVEELWRAYQWELGKKEEGKEEEEPPKPVPTHGAGAGAGGGRGSGYNVMYAG
ncbi:hypothetical protein JCM8547_007008 [Rhodosporidiobolus lusitaniae]